MALQIIPLGLSDLFNSLPIDQTLKPQENGLAFTGDLQGINDVPAYLDPSHVATWVLGYLAAQSDNEKENK